jgi:hypothetical protein
MADYSDRSERYQKAVDLISEAQLLMRPSDGKSIDIRDRWAIGFRMIDVGSSMVKDGGWTVTMERGTG